MAKQEWGDIKISELEGCVVGEYICNCANGELMSSRWSRCGSSSEGAMLSGDVSRE